MREVGGSLKGVTGKRTFLLAKMHVDSGVSTLPYEKTYVIIELRIPRLSPYVICEPLKNQNMSYRVRSIAKLPSLENDVSLYSITDCVRRLYQALCACEPGWATRVSAHMCVDIKIGPGHDRLEKGIIGDYR